MEILKYELQEETRKGARIKVLGIGGGGIECRRPHV